MEAGSLSEQSENILAAPFRGVGYWVLIVSIILNVHILSYFLYRITARYLKWQQQHKSVLQHFQDLSKMIVLTFLYMIGGNYYIIFDSRPNEIVLEYILPFLIGLFLFGFMGEVSYFRVRLYDMMKWKIQTWAGFLFLVFLTIALVVLTFIYCQAKEYYFVGLIPCVAYFLAGFILSVIKLRRRYHLHFHPRSYQMIFSLCILRKDNNFYSRLFAGLCSSAFVRCIAANPILSLLEESEEGEEEEEEEEEVQRRSGDANVIQTNRSNSILPVTINSPLLEECNTTETNENSQSGVGNGSVQLRAEAYMALPEFAGQEYIEEKIEEDDQSQLSLNISMMDEEEEDAMLETIERYNRGESALTKDERKQRNLQILEEDEHEDEVQYFQVRKEGEEAVVTIVNTNREDQLLVNPNDGIDEGLGEMEAILNEQARRNDRLYGSRASDYADWSDQQKRDLLGDYE